MYRQAPNSFDSWTMSIRLGQVTLSASASGLATAVFGRLGRYVRSEGDHWKDDEFASPTLNFKRDRTHYERHKMYTAQESWKAPDLALKLSFSLLRAGSTAMAVAAGKTAFSFLRPTLFLST